MGEKNQDVRQAADPAIVSSLPVSEYKAARPRSATSHAPGGKGKGHGDVSTVDYDAWSGLQLCVTHACMCHVGKPVRGSRGKKGNQFVVPEKKDQW